MLLKEYLSENFTKEELKSFARVFGFRNYSGLRKAELTEKLAKDFCSEKNIRKRAVALSDDQLRLFRKACKSDIVIRDNDMVNALWLAKCFFGSFDDVTDKFFVFEDIVATFLKVDDDDFKSEHIKKGWLVMCLSFASQYYGIAPVEIIHSIFTHKVKCTKEEMITLISEIPLDMSGDVFITMEELGLMDWPKDHTIYSECGLIIDLDLLEYDEVDELLDLQTDKEFYIPSVKQIEELYNNGYETSSLEYKRLGSFLRKRFGLPSDVVHVLCVRTWENSYDGDSPFETIQDIADVVGDFDYDTLDDLAGILALAYNSTRMVENRGNTPAEQRRKDIENGYYKDKPPVLVPGSSRMADILEDLSEDFEDMGITFDLDVDADFYSSTMFPNGLKGDPVVVEKKVYPNDPCPCGSGKKYKNCCGKNK